MLQLISIRNEDLQQLNLTTSSIISDLIHQLLAHLVELHKH